MAHGLCLLTLCFSFFSSPQAQPIDSPLELSSPASRALPWLGPWNPTLPEGTISIVDQDPIISFPSRAAAFGLELRRPLQGYVFPLSSFTLPCSPNNSADELRPNLGCPMLCITGPHWPKRDQTWVALVQRGECEFVNKVREAQRLGAEAVIVGGDDPHILGHPDVLVHMYSPEDASDVGIASTFIKHSDYMMLYAFIASSNVSHSGLRTLPLLITQPNSGWRWCPQTITNLVVIVVVIILSALTLGVLFIRRVRARHALQRGSGPESLARGLPGRVETETRVENHAKASVMPSTLGVDVGGPSQVEIKPTPQTGLAPHSSSPSRPPTPVTEQTPLLRGHDGSGAQS